MENNYSVYKHTSPSGKVYIGITGIKPKDRWDSGFGYKGQVFERAIKKYGWENITHEILFTGLSKEEACKKEIELIAEYKSNDSRYGYNASLGGEGGNNGYIPSKEQRKAMGARAHQLWQDQEYASKILRSIAQIAENQKMAVNQYLDNGTLIASYGSQKEAEEKTGISRKRICYACKHKIKAGGYYWRYLTDKPLTNEEINKPIEHPNKRRPIIQMDKNGNEIRRYSGIIEAERITGISTSNIYQCCSNRSKTAGGFIWRYAN